MMEDYRRRQPATSPNVTSSSPPPMKESPSPMSITLSQPSIPSSSIKNSEQTSVRRVVLSVLFFCASSLGAIFVNKACLTHYKFNYPSTLMVLQAVLTIILLSIVSKLKPSLVSIIPIKSGDYKRLIPSTIFFVSNVTVGLSALSKVNIPMFSAFRRLTVLFVMGAEYFMLHKTHSNKVIISVCILTLGAFVSALGDVTFTVTGYFLVFLNNLLTAAYLASIKRIMRDLNLDPISLLYYTSVLAFPIIFCIAIATNDIQSAYLHYYSNDFLRNSPFFLPALSFVAISAFCVNLSTSMCTHVTSPLTTSVAGQIKNVLQSFLGFFSWGYVPTPLNIFGLLVALGGQMSFAYFKYNDSKSTKTSAPSTVQDETSSSASSNTPKALPSNNTNSNNVSSSQQQQTQQNMESLTLSATTRSMEERPLQPTSKKIETS